MLFILFICLIKNAFWTELNFKNNKNIRDISLGDKTAPGIKHNIKKLDEFQGKNSRLLLFRGH